MEEVHRIFWSANATGTHHFERRSNELSALNECVKDMEYEPDSAREHGSETLGSVKFRELIQL
jgi:hypothetical protein